MSDRILAFICPPSEEGSDTRKRLDNIMNNIIEPLAKEFGYIAERMDEQCEKTIIRDIVKTLREAEIVVADLSGLNPNVFYELGLREATKGKCINIILDDEEMLPFDIGNTRAIRYKYGENGFVALDQLREELKSQLLIIQDQPWQSCMDFSTREIADIFNITVVADFKQGDKNQYDLATSLFNSETLKPKNVFLMQRSSSLVLSAAEGLWEENNFLDGIRQVVNKCEFFYHIIAIDGIQYHFKRKNGVFPHFKDFAQNLENVNGIVAIKKDNPENKQIFYLRKLPKDTQDSLFKLDRQARVFIVEYDNGNTSAVVVQNLGSYQTCFLIEGEKANEYLQACISFYNSCELVAWSDITTLYKGYQRIEESRDKKLAE